MNRTRLLRTPKKGAGYFRESTDLEFIHSGCVVLDRVLGGGWPIGRISNVIGDKSTNKTGLAIEAVANAIMQYPGCRVIYDDAEHAFDEGYAKNLGIDPDRVEFRDSETVEEWYQAFEKYSAKPAKKGAPTLVVLDSLDSLSDLSERTKAIDKQDYNRKAAAFGRCLRKMGGVLERNRIHLMIVSQIRDNIGVSFGKRHKRSGGKALDFWAAQCLWLAKKGTITKTRNKIKRVIGINVIAQCEKNKVGLPFRSCEFPVIFYYGIDDEEASRTYLESAGVKKVGDIPGDKLPALVKSTWREVESSFLPKRRKYV